MKNGRVLPMKKTALVIMAAGVGSRFGNGIKQLAPVGPNGEIIMDYSIRDAKEAGFNKVVFIIRKDIFEEFEEIIGSRIKDQIDVEYVFQELDDLPEGFEVPEGRTKPWGTGQAVLCCKDIVKEPFVIINADDYYGKEAFVKLHDFLVSGEDLGREFTMGMAGFILKNTLSDNGTVTRGVSVVDENGLLSQVHETTGIMMGEDGKIKCDLPDVQEWISPEDKVSMNMWAAYPEFLEFLAEDFKTFLSEVEEGDLKKEYLLPNIVDKLLKEGRANVKVLETQDRWFGVTYQEDKEAVQEAFAGLIKEGVYPANLWG
jgi:NDP-sugar pyrophosphorylase family protein